MRRHRMIRTRSGLEYRRFTLLVAASVFATLLFILRSQGVDFGTFSAGGSVGTWLMALTLLAIFYFGAMLLLTGYFHQRPGGANELKMLAKVVRTLTVFIGIVVIAHGIGWLPKSWAAKKGKRKKGSA